MTGGGRSGREMEGNRTCRVSCRVTWSRESPDTPARVPEGPEFQRDCRELRPEVGGSVHNNNEQGLCSSKYSSIQNTHDSGSARVDPFLFSSVLLSEQKSRLWKCTGRSLFLLVRTPLGVEEE